LALTADLSGFYRVTAKVLLSFTIMCMKRIHVCLRWCSPCLSLTPSS